MSISNKIKFPVSREYLQNYHQTLVKHKREEFVDKAVDSLTQDILNMAATPPNVYGQYVQNVKYTTSIEFLMTEGFINQKMQNHARGSLHTLYDGTYTYNNQLEIIISKLKERFPDCTFTQDPQKKYLFVDWS